jgi:AcrR family transcriptional regulator
MTEKNLADLPKERLLDEAEALFAQKGYHAVSVREITRAAGCNLAAVNYHFGSKENLYLEVFRSRWISRAMRLREYYDNALSAQGSPSPTSTVKALAQAFLEGPWTDEERIRHHLLIARELTEPTEAFRLLAEQVMRPFLKGLADQLSDLLPKDIKEDGMLLKIMSIFGMMFFFNFARVMVTGLTGREYDPEFKARLVEHIVDFSLGGLEGSKKEG